MYYINLATMPYTPNWLKADMAEELRTSLDAHRILDAEFQVCRRLKTPLQSRAGTLIVLPNRWVVLVDCGSLARLGAALAALDDDGRGA